MSKYPSTKAIEAFGDYLKPRLKYSENYLIQAYLECVRHNFDYKLTIVIDNIHTKSNMPLSYSFDPNDLIEENLNV